MKNVSVIYHHESDGWWAESPDIEGWSIAGHGYAEVAKLAEEGASFALGQEAQIEHYVPADERATA